MNDRRISSRTSIGMILSLPLPAGGSEGGGVLGKSRTPVKQTNSNQKVRYQINLK
jgi:hypothetical protein